MHSFQYKTVLILAGIFVLEMGVSLTFAQSVPINSYNNGRIIHGGFYYNTPDSQTTFANTGKGGLWLQEGSTVRALEIDHSKALTNNGGTIQLYAPGSVVRIDGAIDASAISGTGLLIDNFKGNGGNVLIDAAYVYQSGRILANGQQGGLIQMDVGSTMFGNSACLEATGFSGSSGNIDINASGAVDIGRQVTFNTSGPPGYTFDHNVINIEGGLINEEGRLIADGLYNRGGTVRLVSTRQTDLARSQKAIRDALEHGTLSVGEANKQNTRLIQLYNSYNGDVHIASGTSSSQPLISVKGGENEGYAFNDPSGSHTGIASNRGGDGGTITITAAQDVLNGGQLSASGYDTAQADHSPSAIDASMVPPDAGHGGTIQISAGRQIINTNQIVADGGGGRKTSLAYYTNQPVVGKGGDGGLLAFSYRKNIQNTGVIRADGGNGGQSIGPASVGGMGGLMVFSGPGDPTGNGLDMALGGKSLHAPNGQSGTVAMLNPATSGNHILAQWDRTHPMEILTHAENLIFFNRALVNPKSADSLSYWLEKGVIRSILDPKGTTGNGYREVVEKSNIIAINNPVLENDIDGTDLSYGPYNPKLIAYLYRNLILNRFNNSSQTFNIRQTFGTTRSYTAQSASGPITFSPTFSISPLNTYTLLSDRSVSIVGPIAFGNENTGGNFSSISLLGGHTGASGNITLSKGVVGGSVNIASGGGDNTTISAILNGTLHGGSMILKTSAYQDQDLSSGADTSGDLDGGSQQYFSDNNMQFYPGLLSNGELMGGTFYVSTKNSLTLNGGYNIIQLDGKQQHGYFGYNAKALILGPDCGSFCD